MRSRNCRHDLDSGYSWLVCVAAAISNGVAHSVTFGFGVLLPVLMIEFNQNREKTALVGSLIYAVASLFCIVAAKFCDRYGCQRTHIIGTLTCAVSLLVTSFAKGLTYMYFSLSVLYGVGLAFTFTPCFLVIDDYFNKGHSLAVGMITGGPAASYFVFGPYSQAMIDWIGWRNYYRVQIGLLLVCCCFSYWFKPNKLNRDLQQDHRDHGHCISRDSQRKMSKFSDCRIWRIPGFTIPVLSFVIVNFSHFSPAIHMVRRFEEMGVSRKRSSHLFIGVGVGSLLTRIAAGKICEHIRPIHVNRAAILCSGVSTLLLSINSSYVFLVILTFFYGLADGAYLTTFNVIILMSVDADTRATAYGIGLPVTAGSVAVGPMITGLVADHYSYYEAFLVAGGVTLVGLMVSSLLICFQNQHNKRGHIPLKERLVVYEKITVV